MTELTIRPDEIRDALERFVSSYEPSEADKAEVGRVTDTGDGIHASELDSIFGLFAHGDHGRRAEPGLGLGLYLARHVVESHGGTLVAESAGVGRGSVFTIKLPCEAATAAPPGIEGRGPAGDPFPA